MHPKGAFQAFRTHNYLSNIRLLYQLYCINKHRPFILLLTQSRKERRERKEFSDMAGISAIS